MTGSASVSGAAMSASDAKRRRELVLALRISVAAALATIALKTGAWAITGSVGLLADAAESIVNLLAAVVALIVVGIATRPPDEDHAYGHDKADYFSAGFEGGLVLIAALAAAAAAIPRLIDPEPLSDVSIGLAISIGASVVNLLVARRLMQVGRRHDSVILEADGRHLMTDVWTSVGVVVAVAAVTLTGWERLDPIIALVVAANILVTGVRLIRRSASGLMDRALEPQELGAIEDVLGTLTSDDVQFHALRTRRAGRRAFVSVHVLVPGDWSVQQGHDLLEVVEERLRAAVGGVPSIFTHLEPLDDPLSHEDQGLDRGTGA